MKITEVQPGVNYSITTEDGTKLGYVMLGHTDPEKNPKAKQESSRWSFVFNWAGSPEDASKSQRKMAGRVLAVITESADVAERAKAATRKDKLEAAMSAQGLDTSTIAAILKAA